MNKRKVLVIFAHPAIQRSRVNSAMITGIQHIEYVSIRNLYETYPDYHIDIKAEQDLLQQHDIIIWHHPFYWYSAPSILKEWIDLVLEHGFAYGKDGKALAGKQVLSVITTGGSREAYSAHGFNKYTMRQFLIPFERTVQLCKMEYLPPYVIHGSHLFGDAEIKSAAGDYKQLLISLRDGFLDRFDYNSYECLNDLMVIQNN